MCPRNVSRLGCLSAEMAAVMSWLFKLRTFRHRLGKVSCKYQIMTCDALISRGFATRCASAALLRRRMSTRASQNLRRITSVAVMINVSHWQCRAPASATEVLLPCSRYAALYEPRHGVVCRIAWILQLQRCASNSVHSDCQCCSSCP